MIPSINVNTVRKIAAELLISFKKLPGFKNAQVAHVHPIYDIDGTNVAYYEVKFSSPQFPDNGYAIVSATKDDYPVVEFSHEGKSHHEEFNAKLGAQQFKMVRFGPSYITAESPTGALLADIGRPPFVIPAQMRVRSRGEGSDHQIVTRRPIRPALDLARIATAERPLTYKALKKKYVRPKKRNLRYHWRVALSPHSPCTYSYWWADGHSTKSYFRQIPKNTPPNNNDHASGCGPTAWMNIFGWHDNVWTSSLLAGSQTHNNTYIKNLTMQVHDYFGTYEPWFTLGADQGFTWPSDMEKGITFAKNKLDHKCSYWYRHDWWNTDEPWVFRVARDAARKKRPFIVGYYEDWHYAVGWGIAECTKHGWKKHSWIWVDPGGANDSSGDKWIPMGTIFGIYATYDFRPLPSGSVGPKIASYNWTWGWTTAQSYKIGTTTYLFLLKKTGTAADGKSVHIHKMKSNGSVGALVASYGWTSGWTTVEFYKIGTTTYLFRLMKTGAAAGGKNVQIYKMKSNGSVGALVASSGWASGWTTAKFYKIGTTTYLFLLKKTGTAADGKNVHIHKMQTTGKIVGARVASYKWTRGWTTAEFYKIGTTTYLFLLKETGTGADEKNVHIHKMNNNGSVGARVASYKWTRGWTTAEFYKIGTTTYLFLLKKTRTGMDTRNVHIHRMI